MSSIAISDDPNTALEIPALPAGIHGRARARACGKDASLSSYLAATIDRAVVIDAAQSARVWHARTHARTRAHRAIIAPTHRYPERASAVASKSR